MRPDIAMLKESAPRAGFFDRQQIVAVVSHLPLDQRPVVEFTYITGWRVHSEVLPLEWRNVDFEAGEVRLNGGATKNGEGRVFPMTADLRKLLEARQRKHTALKKAGHITPHVFWRMVAKGRGGEKKPQPIVSLNKGWSACTAAGCPGRIPHDMRGPASVISCGPEFPNASPCSYQGIRRAPCSSATTS
jgi:integrase